jgi:hypothetical protein
MSNEVKQPLTYSDVIINATQSIDAKVTVNANQTYPVGTPLVTEDGGKTFKKAVDKDGVVVNGVLCEMLDKTGIANVLVTGKAVAKHIDGLTDRMQKSAFENKIILV